MLTATVLLGLRLVAAWHTATADARAWCETHAAQCAGRVDVAIAEYRETDVYETLVDELILPGAWDDMDDGEVIERANEGDSYAHAEACRRGLKVRSHEGSAE